jgi:hypothetical protein
MDLRHPLNITTREEYYPRMINDLWFTENAWFARLRENIVPWRGGRFIRSVFRYRPMAGFTHYKPGAVHTNVKADTLAEGAFELKFAQIPIVELKEVIQVFNKGDEAIFSLLDEDLENALATMTDGIGFTLWGSGATDDSLPDGLSAMIGDGILPSWNGEVALTYAGVTRADFTRNEMNGNIFWGGKTNGSTGDINFPLLEKAYRKACRGQKEPNLILTNHLGFSAMLNKIEPQYRYYEETTDPFWGGSGYKFHKAYVMVDEHAPSKEGLSDDENYGLGNYKTAAFANPIAASSAGDGKNGFPDSTDAPTLDPGEPIAILNTDEMIMRVDDDPEYGFGFSGFLGNQDSERVVGRIKAAYALQGLGSRYQSLIIGTAG